MRCSWVCLLAVLWGCHFDARGAEFYVDTESRGGAADDANPGTRDKPWKTLGRVTGDTATAPQPGDTVFVRGGTYKESLTLTRGGTSAKLLTLKAFPGEQAVIDGENTRSAGIILPTEGKADYVVIDGLKVANVLKGNAFTIAPGRKGVVLQNVEASKADIGVYFDSCTDCGLAASHIHDCIHTVYVNAPSSDITIVGNHIHHSKYNGISLFGPADRVAASGRIASVEAAGPGLARFTTDGISLNKVKPYGGDLTGQDAAGAVKRPNFALFFFSANGPGIDEPPIPGGTALLLDGRKWFVLRSNPDWDNKPYSPDGKQGLFEIGDAKMEDLAKAKFAYIGHTFDPESRTNRDIQILRNDIHDNGVQGILAPSTDGALMQGNKLHHNNATGIQVETGSRNIWLDGNVSFANCVTNPGETGLWVDEDQDVMIQNNTMYENTRGLSVSHCQRVIVRRNVVRANRAQHYAQVTPGEGAAPAAAYYNSGGIQLAGGRHSHLGAPKGLEDCAVVHNTLYANGADTSFWGGIEHGAPGNPKIGAGVILNNLVQDARGGGVIYIGRTMPAALDGNLYQSAGPVKVQYVDSDKAKSRTYDLSTAEGFAAYRTATGLDAHSLVAPVTFADAAGGNFRLVKGSAAIDKGQPLARTVGAGEGAEVPVTDVRCFSAGFKTSKGKALIQGDEIMVAGAKARVVGIDREKKALRLDRKLAWKEGVAVSYAYSGAGPDVGAFESE